MEFDALQAARTRLCELRNIHLELLKTEEPDGTWDWFLVNEMRELAISIIKEKARLAGRTPLRTQLKYLVASIVRDDRQERKGGSGVTEQDKLEFAKALAELYIMRRREWWAAIDRIKKIRSNVKAYSPVFVLQQDRIKQVATAKWDQLVEVIGLLPTDINEATMQEVARIE